MMAERAMVTNDRRFFTNEPLPLDAMAATRVLFY